MSFQISTLLDVDDFRVRWRRARISAIRRFISPDIIGAYEAEEEPDEAVLIGQVDESVEQQLYRAVFENSKKLGESARWYFGAEWEVSDICEIFPELGVSCLEGTWSEIEEGVVLERDGCRIGEQCGARGCDFFKEAIDGLILGLADDINLARHESLGHGSKRCSDYFLSGDSRHLAFGPLPKSLEPILTEVKKELANSGIAIDFPGQSEGVIYYTWQIVSGSSCRDSSNLVQQSVQTALGHTDSALLIKDITPRAIIGPGTTGKGEESQTANLVTISRKGKKQWNQIVK